MAEAGGLHAPRPGQALAFDDVRASDAPRKTPIVVTPLAKSRWFRASLWLHRWTGLVAAPFFLVLCLTGSVLIFHTEIDQLLGDAPRLDGAEVTAKSWQPFVDRAVGKGERPVSVFFDPQKPRQLHVRVAPPGYVDLEESKPRLIDMAAGDMAKMNDPEATLTGFLLKLHAKWFLGLPGELFGGVIAFLTLVSVISGIVVYAPYVRTMVFGVIRRRGARIVQLDLHNFIGVVMLGWCVVVTVTGVFLALATVLLGAYQQGELKSMAAAAGTKPIVSPVGIDRVIAAAQAAAPDRRARFIVYPDTDYSSPATFTVFLYGTKPYNERLFDVGVVDASDGRVLDVRPLPLHLAALVVSGPLHFGNYGGLALKILWCACAWATMFITGNGAWLWWRRKRSRVPTVKLRAA